MAAPNLDPNGDSMRNDAVSRVYRRAAGITTPPSLDRRVLLAARSARPRPHYLAPLALAASVLLSVAVVLAIAFGPRRNPSAEEPVRLLRTVVRPGPQPSLRAPPPPLAAARALRPDPVPRLIEPRRLYTSDPPPRPAPGTIARDPEVWLADIAALREAGRWSEADAQLRRLKAAYPSFEPNPVEPAGP